MTDPLVPATTIRRLTCERARDAQMRELRRLRIPFRLNREGQILITCGVLDRWVSGSPDAARARLEAVR